MTTMRDRGSTYHDDRRYVIVSPLFGTVHLDFLVKGEAHPCPYIPGQAAREELFVAEDLHPELYHDFMDLGFRRSGSFFYRPVCQDCTECRSLRVPASEFTPTKSQRRILRKNEDIQVSAGPPVFTKDKYTMYMDYLRLQHGSAHGDPAKQFRQGLYSSPVRTLEFEYRLDGRLVAVSIADVSTRSLSSVYAYYDVDYASRSLGTLSALQEIAFCASVGISYYYLGFYVKDCPAMSYKARFKPNEILRHDLTWGRWSGASARESIRP